MSINSGMLPQLDSADGGWNGKPSPIRFEDMHNSSEVPKIDLDQVSSSATSKMTNPFNTNNSRVSSSSRNAVNPLNPIQAPVSTTTSSLSNGGSMNSLSSSGSKLSQNESLKSLKDKVNHRLRSQSSEKIIDASGINSLVAAGVMNNASVEDTPKLTPVKATGKIQQLRNDVMNANPTDETIKLTRHNSTGSMRVASKRGENLTSLDIPEHSLTHSTPKDKKIKNSPKSKTAPLVRPDVNPNGSVAKAKPAVSAFPSALSHPVAASHNIAVSNGGSSLLDEQVDSVITEQAVLGYNMHINNESKALYNDKLLSDRLQEAKAMNRNVAISGASMHQFSLWSGVKAPKAADSPNSKTILPPFTKDAMAVDEMVAPAKKGNKSRGQKASVEPAKIKFPNPTQNVTDYPSRTAVQSLLVDNDADTEYTDDFIDEHEDLEALPSLIDEERPAIANGRGLATALRSKVGNATKIMQQSSESLLTALTDDSINAIMGTKDGTKQVDDNNGSDSYSTKFSSDTAVAPLIDDTIIEEDEELAALQLMSTLKRTSIHSEVLDNTSTISTVTLNFPRKSASDGSAKAVTTAIETRIATASPLSELSQAGSGSDTDDDSINANKNRVAARKQPVVVVPEIDFSHVKLDSPDDKPIEWKRGEPIGEGTFGKVFKGLNLTTGELLAIKQLAIMDGGASDLAELKKEINIMWQLSHTHIVRYHGTTQTDRYFFIILEYISGGSIAGMISQFGAFTENLVRRFTYHIICGVDYLHSKGIIHRDIKGANVLVTETGVAKLSDFGCSKQLVGMCTNSLEESMNAIKGSVPWMAPEVIKQSGHGRSSDIWSVGATVIEMVTGKPPWPEFTNNLAALFHVATSKEPPPIPPNISSLGGQFISKCMVIDPKLRASATGLVTSDPFMQEEVSKQNIRIPVKHSRAPGKGNKDGDIETNVSMRMAYEIALEESL